jgi:DNA-binding Lrp family transcriptional regulator
MKFLMINGRLLANPVFTATDKLILSFLINLSSQNKRFFGSHNWLSSELGIPEESISKRIAKLLDFDIIRLYPDGLGLSKSVNDTCIFTVDTRSAEQLSQLVYSLTNSYMKVGPDG